MASSDSVKVKHVSVSITTEEENQPTPALDPAKPLLNIYFWDMNYLGYIFMILLIWLRGTTHNNWQSTYKTRNGFFIIMAIISVFVTMLASAILIFTSHFLPNFMRDIHYSTIRCMGYVSAINASVCICIAVVVPIHLNPWIAYPVIGLLYTVYFFVSYCFLWKHVCAGELNDDQVHFRAPYLFAASVFLMMTLFLALNARYSVGVHWVRYMVFYIDLTILGASCFVVFYLAVFYGRKQQVIGTTSSSSTSDDSTRQQQEHHQSSASAISLAT